MEESDVLSILAEIFAAFAGFTGIVAALGQRSEGKWRPVDVIRFRGLLHASLGGVVMSLTPFGLYYLGVGEAVTWAAMSAVLAVTVSLFMIQVIRAQIRIRSSEDPDFVPGVRVIILSLTFVVVPVLLANALGIGLQREFAGYLVGLLFVLIVCSTMFGLLLRFVRSD